VQKPGHRSGRFFVPVSAKGVMSREGARQALRDSYRR
jgi:hypothetical protein